MTQEEIREQIDLIKEKIQDLNLRKIEFQERCQHPRLRHISWWKKLLISWLQECPDCKACIDIWVMRRKQVE